MPFSGGAYNPETVVLITRALDAAWKDVLADHPALDPDDTRKTMALLIMRGVDNGIREPDHLKRLAMIAVEGRLN